jgi:dihydrofolate reductase
VFKCIVAYDENYGLGLNNHLPWNMPEDLKLFKSITQNHSVLMGRKTFESIGKPLSNRKNYVLSKTQIELEGVFIVRDLADFIQANKDTEEIIFVIGGASVYAQMIQYCKELYISEIRGLYLVDSHFPNVDFNQFKIKSFVEYTGFIHKVYERIEMK